MTAPALVDADLLALPAPAPTWSGLLLPTNVPAGDGRVMLHDGSAEVPARPLPLPLLAQRALAEGHEGAIRVGMIRRLWMEPDGVHGEGTFNDDPDGQEWACRVSRGEGWVSIDLSDVRVEQVPVDDDGNEIPVDQDDLDAADLSAQMQLRLTGWKVMGATLVSQPAFEDARVEAGALAASGVAGARVRFALPGWTLSAPTAPSPTVGMFSTLTAAGLAFDAADFADPGLDGPTALTIDENGRVFGHLATWGTCHIGFSGVCVTAPASMSDYAYFRQGVVKTTDGGQVNVGKITMNTGHASTAYGVDAVAAAAHYDNTGTCVALVAAGEDEFGIWLAGHMLPGVAQAQVDTLRHSGISGDWREIGGDMELIAALAVNVPGFPVPRSVAASGVLVAAGVVTPGAAARARASMDHDELVAMRRRVAAAALGPMRARVHAVETAALRTRVAAAADRVGSDHNLVKYWTAGKGLARWKSAPNPYTTLVRELRREIPRRSMTDEQIKGLAANYFRRVHGYWPGHRMGKNPLGPGALVAAAGEHDQDGMVALLPSAADAARLAVAGGEPAEELHVTVGYFPDASAMDPEHLADVVTDLFPGPIQGEVSGRADFTGDRPCAVYLVQAPGLAAAHGVIAPEDGEFDAYVPHITAGYDVGSDALAADLGTVTFDRARISVRGEHQDVPLGALTAAGEMQGGAPEEEQARGQRIVRTQEGAERYGVAIGDPIPVGGKSSKQQSGNPVIDYSAEKAAELREAREAKAESKKKGGKSSSSGGSSSKKSDDTTTKGEVPSGSKKLGSGSSARKSGDSAFMEEDESPDKGAKGGKLTKFESGVAYYDDGTMSDGKSWYTAGEAKTSTKATSTKTTTTGEKTTKATDKGSDASKSSDPITNLVQSILALFTGKPSAAPSSGPQSNAENTTPTPEQRRQRVQQTRDMMAELGRMLDEEERQTSSGQSGRS